MNIGVALLLATILGQAVGIMARYLPFIPNKLVPKIAWVANFVANVLLVVQKFLESLGLTPVGVAWYEWQDESTYAYAGIGMFWKGVLAAVVGAVIAYAQTAVQRWIAEKGVKPVNSASGEPGKF